MDKVNTALKALSVQMLMAKLSFDFETIPSHSPVSQDNRQPEVIILTLFQIIQFGAAIIFKSKSLQCNNLEYQLLPI